MNENIIYYFCSLVISKLISTSILVSTMFLLLLSSPLQIMTVSFQNANGQSEDINNNDNLLGFGY